MGSLWARTDARGICQTLCADVAAVAGGSYKSREPPEIHGGAFAPISLEAALWAFHRSASFAEGALLAANLGDDADTTAAIYGMLAGAYYGEKGLPADWLQTLFFGPLIGAAADALRGLAAAAGTGSGDGSGGGRRNRRVGGRVAQAKAAEKVATEGASEEECAASFLRLVDVQTLVETRYAAVRGKLSPGPGPPMAWPGGYKSVAAFEAAIEEIEREVAERGRHCMSLRVRAHCWATGGGSGPRMHDCSELRSNELRGLARCSHRFRSGLVVVRASEVPERK